MPYPGISAALAACLAGERGVFVGIVQRHQALVFAVAYQGTGDFAGAEDAAKDTFVTAWKKRQNLGEPEKLRSWLMQIVLAQDSAVGNRR